MNLERIKTLEKFISSEPSNPFNHYALAMEYYDQDPLKAEAIFQILIKEHPGYLPTYYKAAQLSSSLEKWDQAEDIFTKGILLAQKQDDQKVLSELKSAYQNFQFERD